MFSSARFGGEHLRSEQFPGIFDYELVWCFVNTNRQFIIIQLDSAGNSFFQLSYP